MRGPDLSRSACSTAIFKEAASAGYYHSKVWNQDYPKIQILTIEDLLKGKPVQMPPDFGTFKQAQRVNKSGGTQGELGI